MSATLETQELPNGLSFRVTEHRHIGRIWFAIAIGTAATIFFIHFSQSLPLKVFVGGFCVFSVGRSIISSMRGTDVELVITNLAFRSTGHSPRDGYKSAIVSRADIQHMGFRKSYGGGEDTEYPSGLYVECSCILFDSATCLLPEINEAQTNQVMEAIYRRFPDTSTLAPVSSKSSDLTLLNLSRPAN